MEAAGDEHGFRGAWPPRALLELCLPQPPAPFSSRKAQAGRPHAAPTHLQQPRLLRRCPLRHRPPPPRGPVRVHAPLPPHAPVPPAPRASPPAHRRSYWHLVPHTNTHLSRFWWARSGQRMAAGGGRSRSRRPCLLLSSMGTACSCSQQLRGKPLGRQQLALRICVACVMRRNGL